mmetsp:Transcript_13330/g.46112  ORF Transcript_13330/g.46112 Transcript_13330/m.46112 type:complete len:333 (-) Transcript_13330:402-1400(-)
MAPSSRRQEAERLERERAAEEAGAEEEMEQAEPRSANVLSSRLTGWYWQTVATAWQLATLILGGLHLVLSLLNALFRRESMRQLFDEYAGQFDKHLETMLAYRGPALLYTALLEVGEVPHTPLTCRPKGWPRHLPPNRATGHRGAHRWRRCLDAGCGTGLCGPMLVDLAADVNAVDISGKSVKLAEARGCYRSVERSELVSYLCGLPACSFDLVVAADVLCYFGRLERVFQVVKRSLWSEGHFAFSVELFEGGETEAELYRSPQSGRYAHSDAYIRRVALAAGLTVVFARKVSTRRETCQPVPCALYVLQNRDQGGEDEADESEDDTPRWSS